MNATLSMPALAADPIGHFELLIDNAVSRAAAYLRDHEAPDMVAAFNVRGELYDLAHQLAPAARREEVQTLHSWLTPHDGEVALDVAAGSGFLTARVAQWTNRQPYAMDPSLSQLHALRRNLPDAIPILGRPDEGQSYQAIPPESVDFAVSLGAIHHVDNQPAMFEHVASVLKPGGRFVFGDGCGGTSVTRHFDEHVARHCLTGHTAKWLTPDLIRHYIEGLPLKLVRVKVAPIAMQFSSEAEMTAFFKALHAYPLSAADIAAHLRRTLGVERRGGRLFLQWPLLYTHLIKTGAL